ncbi:MAG: protein kinase [Acidimicrobiia bacterium]|nr:protein kinase [Acidimicrobiia bacterium]
MIGRGGFSVVYAASHTLFKRRMAVKLLNPLTKESERLRFERECEVMGRLSDHTSVVSVYNAGYTTNDRPYLLMELVEGGTLQDQLEARGRLPWREAVGHLLPICGALEAAHRESILHRDVKPENILLTTDGETRLADFGIASLRDATGATSTHITASMLHTAPETFANQRDERSDLYSLASTLYALVVGRAPFWYDTDQSIHPLMNRLLNDPAPAIPAELAPPELSLFVQRALAKDPDHRPQTADDFARELERYLVGDPDSEPDSEPDPDATSAGGPPPTPDRRPEPPASGRLPAPPVGVGLDSNHERVTGGPAAPEPWSPNPLTASSAPVDDLRARPLTGTGPTAAGWYYATGDPPGTQRFWNGAQWQGGPTPVDAAPGPYTAANPPGTHPVGYHSGPVSRSWQLASPERRILGRLIDQFVWVGMWVFLLLVFIPTDSNSDATYLQILALGLWTTAAIAAYEIFMVTAFGATLGKMMLGMRVVGEDGSKIGFTAAAMRMVLFIVLSVLSTLLYVPFLIMLVVAGIAIGSLYTNDRRQTFWDRHAKTLVVHR